MGRVLAFPHGFGLLLAVLFGLADRLHPGLELLPEGGADGLFLQDAIQFRQEGLDVADDAQIDGTVPSDLIRQDVDLNEFGAGREDLSEDIEEAETVAEKKDQIGAEKGHHGRTRPDGQGRFETEGVGVGNDAPSRTRRKGRNSRFFNKLDEFLSGVGIPGAAAGDDDGIFRRLEEIDDLRGVFPVNGLGCPVSYASS